MFAATCALHPPSHKPAPGRRVAENPDTFKGPVVNLGGYHYRDDRGTLVSIKTKGFTIQRPSFGKGCEDDFAVVSSYGADMHMTVTVSRAEAEGGVFVGPNKRMMLQQADPHFRCRASGPNLFC